MGWGQGDGRPAAAPLALVVQLPLETSFSGSWKPARNTFLLPSALMLVAMASMRALTVELRPSALAHTASGFQLT